jgi:hypothetical protein
MMNDEFIINSSFIIHHSSLIITFVVEKFKLFEICRVKTATLFPNLSPHQQKNIFNYLKTNRLYNESNRYF